MRTLELGSPLVIEGKQAYIAKTAQGLFVGEVFLLDGAPHRVVRVEQIQSPIKRLAEWSTIYVDTY